MELDRRRARGRPDTVAIVVGVAVIVLLSPDPVIWFWFEHMGQVLEEALSPVLGAEVAKYTVETMTYGAVAIPAGAIALLVGGLVANWRRQARRGRSGDDSERLVW